jgi:outer membrane protein assembly factor BamB
MQTLLIYDGYLYNAGWNGSVTCYDPKTGEEIWRHKAGSGNSYTSSPVASDGRIYITDDAGMVYVLLAGPAYKLIGKNVLGEICMTTPAITNNIIYFRTINHVIAITQK